MNTYEALIVFKPILDVEATDGVLKTIETSIGNLNGQLIKMDKVGRKRLAYEIAKFKDGFITTFLMQLPSSAVADFKKSCHLNEDILRLTLIRCSEAALAASANSITTVSGPGGGFRESREHYNRGDRGPSDFGRRNDMRPPAPRFRDGGPSAPPPLAAPVSSRPSE